MKNPFKARMPNFNAKAIHETIRRALASAGLDTTAGPLRSITETLRRALGSGDTPDPVARAVGPRASQPVMDVEARVIDLGHAGSDEQPTQPPPGHAPVGAAFLTGEFSHAAGTRSYKLYVPARSAATALPMVVMLHGCTQSADDFAAGTQMNGLADEHGFMVLYPEQAAHANPAKCWNWFKAQDQLRDAGEPALLAAMVSDLAARHAAERQRIFVAGLSAGAAMAVILGETYPELFAAVGAHSGLPYGSAHDVASAMAAMKGGRGASSRLAGLSAAPRRKAAQAVPIIVFHGDRDHTVQVANGSEIVEQAKQAHQAAAAAGATLRTTTQPGVASGGRRYSRTVHTDATGQAQIESWTLHGAGHAWSGGSASGSYTDAAGPDASAEMLRFFIALPRAGRA